MKIDKVMISGNQFILVILKKAFFGFSHCVKGLGKAHFYFTVGRKLEIVNSVKLEGSIGRICRDIIN